MSFASSARRTTRGPTRQGCVQSRLYLGRTPADEASHGLKSIRCTGEPAFSRKSPFAGSANSGSATREFQMPAFRQHGILVYFAAWKEHIGMYPPISGDKAIEQAVARYAGPKGNLQFPLDEPMPIALIERIVKLRVKQDAAKTAARRKKK